VEGFVYKWTNRLNGRWYIGSHAGVPSGRYTGSGKVFKLAIRKYGIQNFDRKILYQGSEFLAFETQILQTLNAAADPTSYNLKNFALGGTTLGITRSIGTRQKISCARKRRALRDGFLNSTVTRDRISISLTGRSLPASVVAKIRQNSIDHGCKPPVGSHTMLHSLASRKLISRNTSIGMLAKKLNITFQEAELIWQKKQ